MQSHRARCLRYVGLMLFLLALAVALLQAATPVDRQPVLIWEVLVDDDGVLGQWIDNERGAENAAFSPDGSLIATVAKGDASVRLLDTETGQERWRHDGGAEMETVDFTLDGKHVLAGGSGGGDGGAVVALDAVTGQEVARLTTGTSVEGLRVHTDAKRGETLLITGDEHGLIRLWNITGSPADWHSEPICVLEQGDDQDRDPETAGHADVNQIDVYDETIYAAGRNGVVTRHDLAAPHAAQAALAGLGGSLKAVRVSPDGRYVAASNSVTNEQVGAGVAIWNVATGDLLAVWCSPADPDRHNFETLVFTPDSRTLLLGGSFPLTPRPQPLLAFDVADLLANGHKAAPAASAMWRQEYISFNPAAPDDSPQMLTAHDDGGIRLWRWSPAVMP